MKQATTLLFSFRTLIGTLCIALVYVLITITFINHRFLFTTLLSNTSVHLKFMIFYDLFLGAFSAFGALQGWLLGINAFLVGLNTMMLIKTIRLLRQNGALEFSFGGLTILSLISSGCSACGVSVLATVGLGSALSLSPFLAVGLQLITTILLVASLSYMIYKLLQTKVCRL